jgi:hypothetical protein
MRLNLHHTQYVYDDAWPYYYGDNGCWAIRFVRGAYRRVWVCY